MGEVLIQVWLKLLDKQVNAKKDSLKNLPGFMQVPASPRKKCAMKTKQTRKKDTHVKMLLMEGGSL